MAPKRDELIYLFEKHISGTKWREKIHETQIAICHIHPRTKRALNIQASKVTLTSIALKHVYDKHIFKVKLEKNFNFILKHIRKTLQNPDVIKLNKPGRRGDYCFIKTINNIALVCTLQKSSGKLYVVTAFVLTDKGYLEGSKTIWKF